MGPFEPESCIIIGQCRIQCQAYLMSSKYGAISTISLAHAFRYLLDLRDACCKIYNCQCGQKKFATHWRGTFFIFSSFALSRPVTCLQSNIARPYWRAYPLHIIQQCRRADCPDAVLHEISLHWQGRLSKLLAASVRLRP